MATIVVSKRKKIEFEKNLRFEQMRELNELLTESARKIHSAILAASFLSKENWIEICYKELGLHYDIDLCIVKLKTIDEFFKNRAIEFWNKECAESKEQPSAIIGILLKYNF